MQLALGVGIAALFGSGCAATQQRPTASAPVETAPASTNAAVAEAPLVLEPQMGPVAVERVKVSELIPDDARRVRVEAVVVDNGQLRMVPPHVVFTARDSSGVLRVRLAERKLFQIGTRLELIGRYTREADAGAAALDEPAFVVERYFELPPGTQISGAAWLP